MVKEYYGCLECGKPIEEFKNGVAYAIGCLWQNPFCSKKCILSNTRVFIEKLPIEEAKQHFHKIEKGMNQ